MNPYQNGPFITGGAFCERDGERTVFGVHLRICGVFSILQCDLVLTQRAKRIIDEIYYLEQNRLLSMEAPRLQARLHPDVRNLIESGSELPRLMETFGSPTHVVFPQIFQENARRFRNVLDTNEMPNASIQFAAKVNKADCFLEQAAGSGIGIDVSSLQELQAALGHGIRGESISISGPSKNPRLQLLGIQTGSTLSVDNFSELQQLIALAKRIGTQRKIPIVIRLGTLSSQCSRFGMDADELTSSYQLLSQTDCPIHFRGFAFHLAGYSTEERADALRKAMEELDKARGNGFQCNFINIGGGFAVNYVDEEEWQRFVAQRQPSMFMGNKDFQSFYPYGGQKAGAESLRAILASRFDEHRSLAHVVSKSGITLAIEPGRSLVDQAGITCMQVKNVKRATDQTLLVEVDANINHLSEQWFGTEYCVDPIHLPHHQEKTSSTPIQASVVGNTCLEIDVLSWRKIGFASMPRNGDILVYPNTAGYQMDSNETEFHRLPLPHKVAAFKRGDAWHTKLDSQYSLLDSLPS
ncbi:MAG: hypothetical protein PHS73_00500 [Candidatus Peribacteraceae bacterium]|nr:hypothetical protein [Candidatus Peribacteraceae bacterium]